MKHLLLKNSIIFIAVILLQGCSKSCVIEEIYKPYKFSLECGKKSLKFTIDDYKYEASDYMTKDFNLVSIYEGKDHIVVSCIYEKVMNIDNLIRCDFSKNGDPVATATVGQ